MSQQSDTPLRTKIDRREALRRGALVGGALMWATPVVQSVAMRTAVASTPVVGADCPSHLDIKVECAGVTQCLIVEPIGACGDQVSASIGRHPTHGNSNSGHCLDASGCNNSAQGFPDLSEFSATSSDGGRTWQLTMPAGCTLVQGFAFCGIGSDHVPNCTPSNGLTFYCAFSGNG